MDKQFVTTSASPHIMLDVSGDLRLKGQDDFEVVAKSDHPDDILLDAREDQITIHSNGDCNVRVPRLASVQILASRGDAVIKALEGKLTVDSVDGSLELRNVGETNITRVNGDLAAKNVDGAFSIEHISGNVTARSLQGDFTVTGIIDGNLNLSDVSGSVKASVNGNIMVRLDPAPGHQFEFTANGNLFCRLPEDASVEISVPRAGQVRVDLPGIHASAPVQSPYALTLGEGDAKITLSAGGNVMLDTHAPDWDMEDFDIDMGEEANRMADSVSEQITQQVDSQVRMIENQLNAQLSSLSMRLRNANLSEDQARRIEERARQTSERAAARAQERMRRAQEKMEQKMSAMQRRMELRNRERDRERLARHSHRHWNLNIPTPPEPPTPAGEPVSEDERLMILRMLEEKQISIEEADQLLSALEGKE